MTSPRIAAAYRTSGGALGSEDATLRGDGNLRTYFAAGMESVANLRLDLLHVTLGEGPKVGIVYRRESGNVAVEVLTIRPDGRAANAEVLYGDGTM